MPEQGASVGGDWTGVYDYGDDRDEAVAFAAMLFDVGGVIWGTVDEPNSFAPIPDKVLVADVSGTRSGREVRFRKTYQGAPPGGEYPVDYAGHLSADGRRIEGRWRLVTPFASLDGPFVMDRQAGTNAVRTMRARAGVLVGL